MLNVFLSQEIRDIAKKESDSLQVPYDLLCAIISVESSGMTKLIRYEKAFSYVVNVDLFAKKLKITNASELMCQKTSWGLMQIMGGTARGHGFDRYLTDLLMPEEGIHWGAVHLRSIMDEYVHTPDIISVYNAGHIKKDSDGNYLNLSYVKKVLSRLSSNSLQ